MRLGSFYYFVSGGFARSNAVKKASKNLLDWLQRDYHLSLGEATQVMSTTIEYTIGEIADPNVVAVAKIRKKLLQGLPR